MTNSDEPVFWELSAGHLGPSQAFTDWTPKAMKLPTRRAAARPTLEARIVSVERGNNSMNGNPSYWLTLDNGQRLRTQSDSSLAYEITNPAYVGSPRWDVPAPLLKLTLSAAGYIETAEVIGK